MTLAQTLEARIVNAPVDLEIAPVAGGFALRARWDDGERERELTLRVEPDAESLEAVRPELEALLSFCYEAGFADASNPRFFVP